MKFGVFMFPTDFSMSVVDLGRTVEARGFESLWVPEHTHIPASRLTPFPAGTELPPEYSHIIDPFVSLAAVAAVTTTLKLGIGVCLVIEHDPITLAKQVSSLDYLSGGRFLLGVGGGWNREEMVDHGTDPSRRWKVLRERVQAMKQLWTQDEASYHGEFVNFDRAWQWPKPVQQPHPPVVVGGDGPNTLRRVVEYGDEWMPIVDRGTQEHLPARIAELQRLAAEKGRGTIPVTAFGCPPRAEWVERLQAMGVQRCIFTVPPASVDLVTRQLDRAGEAMTAFV